MKPQRTTATPLNILSDAQAASMLPKVPAGTDERALPLGMRGGLMGVFGFGHNPAREHLDRLETKGSDSEQR